MDFDPDKLKRDDDGNVLRSELLRINKPVLRKLSPQQCRTIVRWLRGPKYWNAWAEKMLARRKVLEEKGEWEAEENILRDERGLNAATREWLQEAKANFSNLHLFLLDQIQDKISITTSKQGKIYIIFIKDLFLKVSYSQARHISEMQPFPVRPISRARSFPVVSSS